MGSSIMDYIMAICGAPQTSNYPVEAPEQQPAQQIPAVLTLDKR